MPAHCRVTGVIETEINFELLLPDDWNGRFLMGGGGGFVGSVQNQARSLYAYGGSPLQRGYATAGTDTGPHRHRHRGRLGARQSRAPGELRAPRRPPDGRNRPSRSSRTTTRSPRTTPTSVGCSRGGGPGDDGVAALPGRLRRHRGGRAGLPLDRHHGRVRAEPAGDLPRRRPRRPAADRGDARAARIEHPRRVRRGTMGSRTACWPIRGGAASTRPTSRAAPPTARATTA